ncbi:MAG: hypothetical protein ABEH47_01440 [Haloferacaceae archaeon]
MRLFFESSLAWRALSDDSRSESSWKTGDIETATDEPREELEKEQRSSSGPKSHALEEAREYVDRAEPALKKKA